MRSKQQTLKKAVTVSGVGLHTGVVSTMKFLPAGPNHGIKFKRVDLPDQPVVEADADYVVDVSRGTTIEKNGARVHTVEHTLAALVGTEVDNVMIEIDGPEPPIMDGSSQDFVNTFNDVGYEEFDLARNFFTVPSDVTYEDKERNVEISAFPLNDYRLSVMVDYNSEVLGSQHATLNEITKFQTDFASCRTFCFLHELEMLYKNGLIKGGDVNNAIVIVEKAVDEKEIQYLAKLFNKDYIKVEKEGTLNNVELRYKNEPARHKLLDLVGDLALVGRPIKAQIMAARPGHAANVEFAKKLKKLMKETQNNGIGPGIDPHTSPTVMDCNEIYSKLPHAYPFRLIDKVIYLDSETVVGVKNVTINEPFFTGHFPGNPVFPGVFQIEAMAQTGGILALNTVTDPENYWTYFLSIEKCRFKKMVLPGDTLVFKCELIAPIKRGIVKIQGRAYVGDKLVCEAVMSASIVKKQ